LFLYRGPLHGRPLVALRVGLALLCVGGALVVSSVKLGGYEGSDLYVALGGGVAASGWLCAVGSMVWAELLARMLDRRQRGERRGSRAVGVA